MSIPYNAPAWVRHFTRYSKVYSTRVKPITSTPIFNAGTERFVRDWRSAHVTVTVRDSRLRENDPILGMIFLKVSLPAVSGCTLID